MGFPKAYLDSIEQALNEEVAESMFAALFARPKAETTVMATAASTEVREESFSLDTFLQMVKDIEIPPDPLNGARVLIASTNHGLREARRIANAKNGNGNFFTGIRVDYNPAIPDSQIWGMDKDMKLVKIIKVEHDTKNRAD